MTPLAFDTETYLSCKEHVCPPPVCASYCSVTGAESDRVVVSAADYGSKTALADATIATLLAWDGPVVAHNASFDINVLLKHSSPHYRDELKRSLLSRDKFVCTIIRQKLINLATHGSLETENAGFGEGRRILYSLMSLVHKHFGVDLSSDKKGGDAWRLRYSELEPLKVEDWPMEAYEYAAMDAEYTLALYQVQEGQREQIKRQVGLDPFSTEFYHTSAEAVLNSWANNGIAIDPKAKDRIQQMVEEKMKAENFGLLSTSGILTPEQPARPYTNGAVDKETGLPKMTQPQPASIKQGLLKQYVEGLNEIDPETFPLMRTKPSKTYPEGQISVGAEWRAECAAYDNLLLEYNDYQEFCKLQSTYLPAMENADGSTTDRIYFRFNGLVSSGRTSSISHGKDKHTPGRTIPSLNIQNVDPRVRECFIPDPGFVMFSIDFSGMELVTAAYTCLETVGYSRLSEVLNKGMDAHGFLAAEIAAHSDPKVFPGCPDKDQQYHDFMRFKEGDEEQAKWWKMYRTFAKPVGLGYPGGMGAKTFRRTAKTQYGLDFSIETAKELKEIWKNLFPEFAEFFRFMTSNYPDPHNTAFDSEDKQIDLYWYYSPMGMIRRGCTYSALLNGAALQTPSAEGSKNAMLAVAEYEMGKEDVFQSRAFVHDELLGQVRIDVASELVLGAKQVMCDAFQRVVPSVRVGAEAALMEYWNKSASEIFNDKGELVVWKPQNDR